MVAPTGYTMSLYLFLDAVNIYLFITLRFIFTYSPFIPEFVFHQLLQSSPFTILHVISSSSKKEQVD